jgi:hypothetical protein
VLLVVGEEDEVAANDPVVEIGVERRRSVRLTKPASDGMMASFSWTSRPSGEAPRRRSKP